MTATGLLLRSKTIIASAVLCLLAVGGFIAWASFAPLAEGVTAYGRIAAETDREVVQHLEGGIIQDVLVTEGDVVADGAPLIVLSGVAVFSGRDQVLQTLADALASVDRLDALSNDSGEPGFATVLDLDFDEAIRSEIIDRQRALYFQQANKLSADIDVLETRRASLLDRARAAEVEIDSIRRAQTLLLDDITRTKRLVDMRMVNVRDLSALEVQEAQLASNLSRLESEQATARAEARELTARINQTRAEFLQSIGNDLVAARREAAALGEQLLAAQDMANRTTIYAPRGGTILNLERTTEGAVIRPGETILEIVPEAPDLIATLRIRPSDRDAVYEGLAVNAKLSGLDSWSSPVLDGRVISVSADLKTTPRGDVDFYEARVVLSSGALADLPAPGMPVEAFVASGQSRTFIEYLTEPVTGVMRRGIRE